MNRDEARRRAAEIGAEEGRLQAERGYCLAPDFDMLPEEVATHGISWLGQAWESAYWQAFTEAGGRRTTTRLILMAVTGDHPAVKDMVDSIFELVVDVRECLEPEHWERVGWSNTEIDPRVDDVDAAIDMVIEAARNDLSEQQADAVVVKALP